MKVMWRSVVVRYTANCLGELVKKAVRRQSKLRRAIRVDMSRQVVVRYCVKVNVMKTVRR